MTDIPASPRRGAVVLTALLTALLAVALAAAGIVTAHAQAPASHPKPQPASPPKQPSGPPNALQGFSQNRDKPVKINATELEVHDKDKMAVFSGDVHLVQGDTSLRSSSLVVYYDDQPPPPQPAPPPSKSGSKGGAASAQITPQQNQQLKKVEAKGNVIVTQKDQTATGNEGVFDMRANTVTIQGSVVITRGPNIMKGDRLTVNMNTGDSAMTCSPPPCRVQLLIIPDSIKGADALPPPGRKP
jgi:lipopolysaccharide export system protein LptA